MCRIGLKREFYAIVFTPWGYIFIFVGEGESSDMTLAIIGNRNFKKNCQCKY